MPLPGFNNLAPKNLTQQQRNAARLRAVQSRIINHELLVDGLFEGGGALGTAYVGALRALEDNNLWFARVAGNSAGAITAAMIAVGFTAEEIQWLSSAFPEAGPAPQSLLSKGIDSPIPFSEFLDLPKVDSISLSEKRRTILWHILKGTLIDVIEDQKIDLIPTEQEAVEKFWEAIRNNPGGQAAEILGFERPIRTALHIALGFLPQDKYHFRDFLPDTEPLRMQFADTMWDEIARRNPLFLISTNLWHEGGIFEGNKFLSVLKELFGKKVHNNASRVVTFNDLKIPLAVIATDIDAGSMIVYSKKMSAGGIEVAEAVRQSMSIPFIFEPRGRVKQIVDGGLCSNFPLWIYTSAGDQYWDSTTISTSRIKVGFSLNQDKEADPTWQTDPPRFHATGNPKRVNTMEVLRPILHEKMIEMLIGYNVPANIAENIVTFSLTGIENGNNTGSSNGSVKLELLEEIAGVAQAVMNTENSTRHALIKAFMSTAPYVDVEIPLLGYHGLDFYVNTDGDSVLAMWDRAWLKTIDALLTGRRPNSPPLQLTKRSSPFNWR